MTWEVFKRDKTTGQLMPYAKAANRAAAEEITESGNDIFGPRNARSTRYSLECRPTAAEQERLDREMRRDVRALGAPSRFVPSAASASLAKMRT
jgi:hypothetical protein